MEDIIEITLILYTLMFSNSIIISFIIGLFLPFKFKHRLASLANVMMSSFRPSFTTRALRKSNRQDSCKDKMKCVANFFSFGDVVDEIGLYLVKSSTNNYSKTIYITLFSNLA